ncbi:MAG: DUF1329 domain-containing protein, partial [Pseudomonadales bacterium]|nr:DUF1329 domain-containing protein [Pseudomonadales bacterium]
MIQTEHKKTKSFLTPIQWVYARLTHSKFFHSRPSSFTSLSSTFLANSFFAALLLLCLLTTPHTYANVSAKEAMRLKHDLTPLGAERASNKSRSIPRWTTDKMTWKKHKAWVQHIQTELPLYHITPQNYKKFQHLLSVGQIEMLKAYPDTFT